MFSDSKYSWTYGSKNNNSIGNGNSGIKTYKINEKEPAVAAASTNKSGNQGFMFRTAESFLNTLSTKTNSGNVDLSKYKAGVKVMHKKFGEGTIHLIEPEGEDLKVDINFDKVGHKRLMARFANLEIIS